VPSPVYSVYCRHRQSDCRSVINNEAGSRRTMLECCCRKLKKIPKNTNGRLAIPALAGLLVCCYLCAFNVNFVVIQNISASFSKLFPNYVPRPPLPRKVGGHDPPAPMGAPPLRGQCPETSRKRPESARKVPRHCGQHRAATRNKSGNARKPRGSCAESVRKARRQCGTV